MWGQWVGVGGRPWPAVLSGGRGAPGARRGPPGGADLEALLAIPLSRVLTGGRETATITRPGPCPECSGSGARAGTTPRSCPTCAGSGQQTTASRRGNVVIRQVSTCPDCAGLGAIIDQPCPDHAAASEPGDLPVTPRTAADPRLARRGSDLWCELDLPVPDAVLGTTATVPGLEGDVTVTVPPGTQPGTMVPIAGQGLPHYRAPGRGSLNVVIAVSLPQTLSLRQRRLYEQLRNQCADTGGEASAAAQS